MTRLLLITSGGLGLLRPAPGTWGSLPSAGLAWALLMLGVGGFAYNAAMIALLLVSSVICVKLGPWAEQRFGKKDPSQIVIDETAGQCIPLLLLSPVVGPISSGEFWRVSVTTGAAFLLFRAADIAKPPPANGLQRLKGGWGVLIDDLIAGVYAALLLQAALYFLA